MTKTQFQSESLHRERSNSLTPTFSGKVKSTRLETPVTGHSSDRSITATVEPMFLGLLIRGWITESEQQFLDDLVPSRSLSFLISDETYIHPAGIELFPHSLIEASIEQRNPAIFTHLCPPVDRRKSGSYMISTVIVNPHESHPLVFGVFGPEYELATAGFEGKFLGLANCLRSGFSTARKAESILRGKELSEKPTIIINRASGRVIAVNQSAADYFGVTERGLVDQELGATRTLLPDLTVGTNRRIDNVTCNGLSLSLVSTTVADDSRPSETELTRFLTREIGSRLVLLTEAHSNSNNNTKQDPRTGLPSLERLSVNIVTHIKHDLEKINLIASTGPQDRQKTNILRELDRAVDTVSKLQAFPPAIQVKNRSVNLEHWAPKRLLANLFETVLMAHLTGSSSAKRTDIHVLHSLGSASVCVKVKTRFSPSQQDVCRHEQWAACAELLAVQAGVVLENRTDSHSAALVTEINIEQNKEY